MKEIKKAKLAKRAEKQNSIGLVKTKENANSAACLQFLVSNLTKANSQPFYQCFYPVIYICSI